jgi:hypothetical protein
MNVTPDSGRDDVIRITRQEAMSSHAEDLLRRQKSLRGESGITKTAGGKWYYHNWFVLMLAGAAAAVVAWAIIEPYFNDKQYLQGPIEALDPSETIPMGRVEVDGQLVELRLPGQGWVVVKGQKIWLMANAKLVRSDGSKVPLDPIKLDAGLEIGVYVEYIPTVAEGVALGLFVVESPPPQSSEEAKLTLTQQQSRSQATGLLVFALVAGLVGLAIGASDGLVCRLPRRALLAGGVGLLVGFISNFVANIVYAPLNQLAMAESGESTIGLSTFGFMIQTVGRSLAWALAGTTAGLGQGIALRSKRLLLYGFLGGVIGGTPGGAPVRPHRPTDPGARQAERARQPADRFRRHRRERRGDDRDRRAHGARRLAPHDRGAARGQGVPDLQGRDARRLLAEVRHLSLQGPRGGRRPRHPENVR